MAYRPIKSHTSSRSRNMPRQTPVTSGKLEDMAYAFLHDDNESAEAPLMMAIRAALARGDKDTITLAAMTLLIKDPVIATDFTALCTRQACFRFEEQYPALSHLLGMPVAGSSPVTFSKNHLNQLREAVVASGLACPDAEIYLHPATVDLENLVTAHPCEIAALHNRIPARKALIRHFYKVPDDMGEGEERLQVLLLVIVVPRDRETCFDMESFDMERKAAFVRLASEALFGGQAGVAPPALLSDVITGDLDDGEDAVDLEKEFSDALMEAVAELGTSDLDAFIHEPDEISLVIDLCESPEDYWTIRVDYGEADWSRSEAFMMVYDVMRDAGIVAILLNDAEDDETGISEDLRPDDEVRH